MAHGGEEGRLGLVGGLRLLARLLGGDQRVLEIALAAALFGDVAHQHDGAAVGGVVQRHARPLVGTVGDQGGTTGAQRHELAFGPGFRRLPGRLQHLGGVVHGVAQHDARRHDLREALHEAPVGLVALDQALVAVEEGDAVVHRFHGEDQRLARLARAELAGAFEVGDVAEHAEPPAIAEHGQPEMQHVLAALQQHPALGARGEDLLARIDELGALGGVHRAEVAALDLVVEDRPGVRQAAAGSRDRG